MRYLMKKKLFSLGDKFGIRNERGEEVFFVNGEVFALGNKLSLEDPEGISCFISARNCSRGGQPTNCIAAFSTSPPSKRNYSHSSSAPLRSIPMIRATSKRKVISPTTSTPSRATTNPSRRSPNNGSPCLTPTASKSPTARTPF